MDKNSHLLVIFLTFVFPYLSKMYSSARRPQAINIYELRILFILKNQIQKQCFFDKKNCCLQTFPIQSLTIENLESIWLPTTHKRLHYYHITC
jgi:hypothetical protein